MPQGAFHLLRRISFDTTKTCVYDVNYRYLMHMQTTSRYCSVAAPDESVAVASGVNMRQKPDNNYYDYYNN